MPPSALVLPMRSLDFSAEKWDKFGCIQKSEDKYDAKLLSVRKT